MRITEAMMIASAIDTSDKKTWEAIVTLIEAAKKQEAIEPIYDHRYAEFGCAFCGNQVSGVEELPNYCPNCGQKLDWEE